jgi:hypothetical protein
VEEAILRNMGMSHGILGETYMKGKWHDLMYCNWNTDIQSWFTDCVLRVASV